MSQNQFRSLHAWAKDYVAAKATLRVVQNSEFSSREDWQKEIDAERVVEDLEDQFHGNFMETAAEFIIDVWEKVAK